MALRLICVAVIVVGTALRFDGLARRPLWYDEAATLLHLQGRTEAELESWYDGRPLRVADLWALRVADRWPLRVADRWPLRVPDLWAIRVADRWPPTTTSAAAVVASVAADEPQAGPGYFVLALAWVRVVGDALATLRALSAVASVIALLLVHRLARVLFDGADVALAATALVAVSPLHVRYAQEARPYALWTALLVAAAVAVARARRRPSIAAWLGYAGAVGAALWVQPLTLLVLPALAGLALSSDRADAARRSARSFWAATALALVTWVPWALVCWRGRATIRLTTEWASAPSDVATLARGWLGVLTSVFYRPAGEGGLLGAGAESLAGSAIWVALGLVAVAVVAGGLWSMTRAGTPARRFVRLLALFPWAVLALADLVWGGRRSTVARYLVPTWIGAALATACFVAGPAVSRRRSLLLLLLVGLGMATAMRTRSVDVWWDTDAPRLRAIAAAADVIAAEGAVVLTDAPPLAVLALAHRLPAATVLRLGSAVAYPPRDDDWEHVALFAPSEALRAAIGAAIGPTRGLVPVRGLPLWRVAPSADGGQ